MEREIANKILLETEAGYDSIAHKFSQTRKHFWRGLEFIGDYAKPGMKILDFGCGNGRLLELIGGSAVSGYHGVDVSEKLVGLARKKYPEAHFSKIDPRQDTLPFEDDYFNTVYSIAVFHHFPSQDYRECMANELHRITQPGGHVVVTAWNLWQKKYFPNVLRNWKDKLLGKSELDWNDCLVPFSDNAGRKFERFHHAFTRRELEKLFESAGFRTEKCAIINGRNIIYIGKK